MSKAWTHIKPVLVLTLICVITSGLLALTNDITGPVIAENARKAQNAAKIALLPEADDFEELDVSEFKGVNSAFKATNDAGYVITGAANGYDGEVPVMIAFDMEGNILGVEISDTGETAGLGKKIETDEFKNQFKGMEAKEKSIADIDAISGATISSSAVVSALNNAIAAYQAFTGTAEEKVDPKLLLMPDATGFTEIDASSYEGVTAIYQEDSGIGYIIIGSSEGYHGEVPVMVAFDQNGFIIGVEISDTEETPGLGKEIEGDAFKSQFAGMPAQNFTLKDIDAVAEATISSKAVKNAVNSAIDAYNAIMGVE